MNYNTKLRRKLNYSQRMLYCNLLGIWEQTLLQKFHLNQRDVWRKQRTKKDVGFIWSLWCQQLIVNTWQAKANQDIRVTCPSCNYEPLKSITHKFLQCLRASKEWETAFNIIFLLKTPPHSNQSWRVLDLEECLYSKKVPGRIRRFSTVWSTERGFSRKRIDTPPPPPIKLCPAPIFLFFLCMFFNPAWFYMFYQFCRRT